MEEAQAPHPITTGDMKGECPFKGKAVVPEKPETAPKLACPFKTNHPD